MNNSFIRPQTTEEVARSNQYNSNKRPPDSPPPGTSAGNVFVHPAAVKRQRPSPPPFFTDDLNSQTTENPPPQPYGTLKPAPDWLGNELVPSQPFGSTQPLHYPTSTAPQSTGYPSTAQIFAETLGPCSIANPRWGLRREIVLGFKSLGITSMYPWQQECLSLPGLLEGERNIVYTAPTSAGKSLVADLLLIRKVMMQKKKAIIVLPYIAIVQEKTRFLRKALSGAKIEVRYADGRRTWRGVNVIGYHSGAKEKGDWKMLDIAVCTIEKANAIVNAAVEERTIDKLGIVVFDELHMLADEHRGFILELLATKLLCLEEEIQLVAMSATLSNVNQLADWLRAHAYACKYRPIPLVEHLVYDNTIFDYEGNLEGHIPISDDKELKDPVKNAMVRLAIDCVTSGHGVLVFCESRAKCETMASTLRKEMPEVSDEIMEARYEVIRSLATCPTGLDSELEKTVPKGVAFHHAGLTTEERDLVAEAYDAGLLKVICCTATMAAGVNLPARRVIVSPRMGIDFVSPAMFRQMRGRAGRKGKDTAGESYVCCRKDDLPTVQTLMTASMPRVTSSLATDNTSAGLTRALLEIISTRLATSISSINMYFTSTLLYHVHPSSPELPGLLDTALSSLLSDGLITLSSNEYTATPTGLATVSSGLSPADGIFLHHELSTALKSFNLETDMHIIYQFTTIHSTSTPFSLSWPLLRDLLAPLSPSDLRAALLIGIKPAFINKMAQGGSFNPKTPEEEITLRVHRRFYISLMLRMLLNETPVHKVAAVFDIARGFVQSLSSTCRGFATTSAVFCRTMGWTGLAVLLEHYAWRLEIGVREELVALAKIPFVKNATARVFWDAGLRDMEAVWRAGEEKVAELLVKAMPRRLRVNQRKWERVVGRYKERAGVVVGAAKKLWEQETMVVEDEIY